MKKNPVEAILGLLVLIFAILFLWFDALTRRIVLLWNVTCFPFFRKREACQKIRRFVPDFLVLWNVS